MEMTTSTVWRDVRPMLQRNKDNSWGCAEEVRDRIYNTLVQASRKNAIEPLILKSHPFIYPPWVKFECWVPGKDQTSTQRASLSITIDPKPFHLFPFEFQIDTAYGQKKKSLRNILNLEDQDVNDLFAYILGWGPKPKLLRPRVSSWQIWRPRQRIKGLIPEFIGTTLVHLEKLLYVGAAILLSLSFYTSETGDSTEQLFLLIMGVVLAACGYASSKRAHFMKTEGRPLGDPRVLIRVDSWQTVVFGAGNEYSRLRQDFLVTASSTQLANATCKMEKVWAWGIDGKEEREQIVLTFKRGIVFCQIYEYGNDLYIGWDGHINTGQWAERTLTTGIDSTTWSITSVNMVTPGTQTITEYDVIDLNCLMEWTHVQLVKLLKDMIHNRKIEQEIDFKILRGQRQGLTNTENTKKKNWLSEGIFRRTA